MMAAVVSDDLRKLTIGRHARRRMTERKIETRMITRVVMNPDVTVRRVDGCTEYIGTWQGRRLKVVINHLRAPPFLVTVHWI
jgi:Domain of unknown function (DUF4258)